MAGSLQVFEGLPRRTPAIAEECEVQELESGRSRDPVHIIVVHEAADGALVKE